MRRLTAIIRCERGANAIEYALVASLIAIAAIVAMENVGSNLLAKFEFVSNSL